MKSDMSEHLMLHKINENDKKMSILLIHVTQNIQKGSLF
jgi:hypothetical protein